MEIEPKHSWVFFGTPEIAAHFLDTLTPEYYPSLVITKPNAPVGRKQILTSPPVKIWADQHNIPVVQYEDFKDQNQISSDLSNYDFFFVFAYGKILPDWLINLPLHKTLNYHPSLLPKYRGPSPIASMILDDQKATGYTLMQIDKKMDHGPVLVQRNLVISEWQKHSYHEREFACLGSELFMEVIDDYINGILTPTEQDHSQATYCGFYSKSDMEIKPEYSERKKWLVYCAFLKPFMYENGKRIVITNARYSDNSFIIERIIPEGGKEQTVHNT